LGSRDTDKYSKIMKKLTDSLSNNGPTISKRDEEFNLADMAESKGPPTELDEKACS
jgi:hypothetical protein